MINRRIRALLGGGLGLLLAGCAQATPAAPTAAEAELTPSVTVGDQDASSGSVTIAEVVAAEPGWLAIHITKNGAPGPVIGQASVSVGSNEDVQVEIDLAKATGQLFAMLHVDAGYKGEYEFPGPDAPVTAADQLVNVPFNATFPIVPSVTVTEGSIGKLALKGTLTSWSPAVTGTSAPGNSYSPAAPASTWSMANSCPVARARSIST